MTFYYHSMCRPTPSYTKPFLHRIVTSNENWYLYVTMKETKERIASGAIDKLRVRSDVYYKYTCNLHVVGHGGSSKLNDNAWKRQSNQQESVLVQLYRMNKKDMKSNAKSSFSVTILVAYGEKLLKLHCKSLKQIWMHGFLHIRLGHFWLDQSKSIEN